jgi:transcriptional regulator with XRE-family HTH domain
MAARRASHREHFARCFGLNLAKARKAADVSQDELSSRASMHRTAVSQIERGLLVPGLDTAVKLAAVLELAVDELLDGVRWRSPEYNVGAFEPPELPSEDAESLSRSV